ncbi:MAG: formylglycine-generating enzyme family protein [Gammaproteobacteria bacterium]|nr:formylglycine-generating enzyme family protein [Gammaproteobacteria bacterium]
MRVAGQSVPSTPSLEPGETFSDPLSAGGQGPQMVVVPAGNFRMGCISGQSCFDIERPVREITIPQAFAVSKYEVTFEDYDRYTHPNRVDSQGWGRGRRPVINVSWSDAQEYVEWLSRQTGQTYRLLSEAEWEYVARAGSSSAYTWGNAIGTNRANCDDVGEEFGICGDQWEKTAPVGSFQANAFGVHDMHGNVNEWVQDCWHGSYAGAPSDGSAWDSAYCSRRVVRGGSWLNYPRFLRSSFRGWNSSGERGDYLGFRVARTLGP